MRWATVWEAAWPNGDADAIAALYAAQAVFVSHPFREQQPPREYVSWAFDEQSAAECRFGVPVVDGERAAIDWWAVVTAHDGSEQSLAGTSLLRFDAHGLVVEQRDAWGHVGERRELPDWARRG